jgi:hypothetical protein
MQDLLKKAFYAAVAAFVWGAYHLNPETAQLKDFLLLLHTYDVQVLFAILLGGQVAFESTQEWQVARSNRIYINSLPAVNTSKGVVPAPCKPAGN